MKLIFLISKNEDSHLRVHPLPHQYLDNGAPINPDSCVTTSKSVRDVYPAGTVFVTSGMASAGDNYALTSSMTPVSRPPVDGSGPSREELSAWESYKRAFGDPSDSSMKPMDEIVAGDTGDTLFSKGAATMSLLDEIRTEHPCPSLSESGYHIEKETWNILVRNIMTGENTMLVGPMGTGKTEIVLLLGKQLGIPVHVYDMGSMHDPMSQMLGTHRLVKDPVTGSTVSGFDYAQFTKDIQEECIILLDELSRAPLTTMNILFPCLDSRRMLPVQMAGGDDLRNIPVNPKCRFIATANVGVEYTGTNTIDKALMSRFFPVELDYLGEGEEAALLEKRTGCSRMVAGAIVKCAKLLRSKYRKGELSTDVSTRETLRAGALVSDGWDLDSVLKTVFLPLYEREERETVSRIFKTR